MACEKTFINGKWYSEEELKNELKNGLLNDLIQEGKVKPLGEYKKQNLTSSQKDVLSFFNDILEANKQEPSKSPKDLIYDAYVDKVKREMVYRNSSLEAANEIAKKEILEPYLNDKTDKEKDVLNARADNFVAHVEAVNLGKKEKPTIGVGIKISDNPAFEDIKPTDSADVIKERALRYVMSNTEDVENMMMEVLDSPRPLTSDEVIQLTGLKALKSKQLHSLLEKQRGLDRNSKDYKSNKKRIDEKLREVEDLLVNIAYASHKTGSEMGQAFALRQLLLTDEFEFATEVAKQENAQGRPLTNAERERLKRLETKFKNIEERLAEIDAEKESNKAIETIKEAITEGNLNKEDDKDTEGDTAEEKEKNKKGEPYINRKGKLKIPRAYILSFIDQGKTEAEDIFEAIKEDLSSRGIDVTERNITDAISNYGNIKTKTPKDREKALAEAKRIAGLLSKIDDAKKGVLPFKLSRNNTAPRVRERELRKQLNELMKQFDITDEVNEAKLKTRLQAIKTRLNNSIEENKKKLEDYNNTGVLDTSKKNRSQTDLDDEARRLKNELKSLQADLQAIKDAEGISAQEALAEALDRIQKRIDLYDQKIQDNDVNLTNTPKEKLFDKKNQEWLDKEDELKSKKREFDKMRKNNPAWVQSEEAKKEKLALDSMKRANDKLRKNLDDAESTNYKSIGYNQKEDRQLSPERQALKDEREALMNERQAIRDELGLTDAERLRKLKINTIKSIEENKKKLEDLNTLGVGSIIGSDKDLKGNDKPNYLHTQEELESLGKEINLPEIEMHLKDGTYEEAIKNGEVSSYDVIKILESYGLNPSKKIEKLYSEQKKRFNIEKERRRDVELDDEARELRAEKEKIKQEQEKVLADIKFEKLSSVNKILHAVGLAFKTPRIFQAGGDVSGTFIQGAFIMGQMPITLITNRKLALQQLDTIRIATKLMYGTSSKNLENSYHKYVDEVKKNGLYEIAKKAGIRFQGDTLESEEHFSNFIAQNIPILGDTIFGFTGSKTPDQYKKTGLRFAKRSEVSYNIMADMFRMQKFEKYYSSFTDAGFDFDNPEGQKELKAVADVINTFTGSASLGAFENSAKALSSIAYSSRMVASKLKVYNPIFYLKQPEAARKVMRKELMTYIGGQVILQTIVAGGVIAWALSNPDDEEDDAEFKVRADYEYLIGNSKMNINFSPLSTDFLKLRIKDETYSMMGGMEQVVKLTAMSVKGKKYNREGFEQNLEGRESRTTVSDLITNFFLNKTAPITSHVIHRLGMNETDVKPTGKEVIAELYTPFVARTFYDVLSKPYDKNNEEQNIAIKVLGLGLKTGLATYGVQVNVDKEFKKKTREQIAKEKEEKRKEGTYIKTKTEQVWDRFRARRRASGGGE